MCDHANEIMMIEAALRLYGESAFFPGPMGMMQLKVNLPKPMEFCPWCKEEIVHVAFVDGSGD